MPARSVFIASPRASASASAAFEAMARRFGINSPCASAVGRAMSRDRNGAREPDARENRAGMVEWAT